MTASELVAALEAIATELGVPVRHEALGPPGSRRRPRGGLCRVRGCAVILLDVTLTASEKLVILANALATLDLTGLELNPAVRAALRAHGRAGIPTGELRPLARTRRAKPGNDG